MRPKFGLALCFAALALSVSCSQADRENAHKRVEEAKEKSRREAERLRADARQLGGEAKQEARTLRQDFSDAVNGRTPAAKDATEHAEQKLQSGAHDLRVEGGKAGVKLDHAAMIAKVKAKLATDVGLSTVTGVEVDARGEVVTLRGTVSSEQQKQQAEQSVSQISGVRKVVDDLRVKP